MSRATKYIKYQKCNITKTRMDAFTKNMKYACVEQLNVSTSECIKSIRRNYTIQIHRCMKL